MALDAAAIRALVNEFNGCIINGRIDKIHQPEKDEIVIHIRTFTDNYKLVLSASPSHPRAHFTSRSKKNPMTAPMFCMLLRKHIGSGKITAVEQAGFERIIKFSIESYDELGNLTVKYLIVEIMGRHSNIILTNQELKILDSIKHIDFTVSSVRQILPGLEYVSPPPQDKMDLIDVSNETELNFSVPKTADKVILDAISGISPLTAREIVYRATKNADVKAPELNTNKQSAVKVELLRLAEKVKNNDFSPCIITDKASGKDLDFSAVAISQYEGMADVKTYASMNEVVDTFFNMRDMRERMKQKSSDIIKLLNNNIERITKKLIILERTLADAENKVKYKVKGDLITANIYKITDGMTEIELQNYYESDLPIVKVTLDPQLTPSQNAQRYYKKYNKAKTAELEAAKQIEASRNDLAYLESTLAAVENAETEADINAIRSELISEGYLNRKVNPKKQKQNSSKPIKFISSDGFEIYVGKNNTQNDYLTLKFANSSDIWFHTKNIHGSHTVIKLGLNKDVPNSTIREAAELAAYYSKARESSQVPVDYTQVKNVKKPNGAKPGMVIYDSYNTVYVTPKALEKQE